MAERQVASFPGTTPRRVRSLEYSGSGAASYLAMSPQERDGVLSRCLKLQSNNKRDLSSALCALEVSVARAVSADPPLSYRRGFCHAMQRCVTGKNGMEKYGKRRSPLFGNCPPPP